MSFSIPSKVERLKRDLTMARGGAVFRTIADGGVDRKIDDSGSPVRKWGPLWLKGAGKFSMTLLKC